MEINPKKLFKDKFPTASVKLLVGSEAVQQELTEILEGVTAAEQTRALNEELRLRNEEVRDEFEMGRQRNEDERIGYEDDRREQETARQGEEHKRVLAEKSREASERDRGDAEYLRVLAENDRVNAERVRDEAYKARVANDELWEGREDKRESRETERIQKESVRESNETTRINNENTRIINESGRVMKEKERVNAEILRQAGYENWKEQVSEYSTRISNNAQEIRDVKEDLTTAPEMNGINQYSKTVNLFDRTSGDKVYPITIPEAVIDKDGNNVLDIIKRYWSEGNTESDVMYGAEWDVTVADTPMTRIGNMALHRQLPIHNRVKGCLLDDDGNVVEYLNPTTWLGATRDGSRGQVMVEIPEHYRKFETDGNIRRTKISEYPLPGYHYVPKMYISAYEATMQRSTSTLCSVVNSDPDYRGGDNNADWDGTYRSLLGMPADKISRRILRESARNRKPDSTEWNIYTYEAHKTLCWLYLIEYANRNSQLPYNGERDANGYRQGGLGDGVTNMPAWGSYNNYNVIIPCGSTDSLGNGTGIVMHNVLGEDGSVVYAAPVPRYRGVENPFGHIPKIVDGASVLDGAIYVTRDTALFSETVDGYTKLLEYGGSGFIKDIYFGENGDIVATEVGGSSNGYWCDQFILQGGKCVTVGGDSVNGRNTGMCLMNLYYASAATRLCFIPKNNK